MYRICKAYTYPDIYFVFAYILFFNVSRVFYNKLMKNCK